jgi:Tol biopolymer transport system component
MSDRDGRQRIWLKDLIRGGEVALTDGPNDTHPRFSPDGSMVLFTRSEAIYRVAIVGGDPRKLVDGAVGGDWSPDGRRIVYVRSRTEGGRNRWSIELAAADGGESHEIAHAEGPALIAPRWSPDGRTIAAGTPAGIGGKTGLVFLVGADGKNPRSISAPSGGASISCLAWSGSNEVIYSQTLAAFLGSGGGARLIRQNVFSGATEQVLSTAHDSEVIDILGFGRLVFDSRSAPRNLREVQLKAGAPSAGGRWLTRGNSTDGQPAYSPDGEWIIFTSNRSGNVDLWEISTKSGILRRITEDPATDWDPGFTPDGKKIIWSSNRSGNLEIWTGDADGSNARQVTHDGVDAENPTATPDGWIAYASGNPAKLGIWKIREDGSQAARLVAGEVFFPEVSPDGTYAAYAGGNRGASLAIVRISAGAKVPFQVPGVAFRPRWMPESRAIAFMAQDEKGVSSIFVQDFAPGKDTAKTRRKVTGSDTDMRVHSYGISPDGSRMTVSYEQDQYNLMTAERVPGVLPPARR